MVRRSEFLPLREPHQRRSVVVVLAAAAVRELLVFELLRPGLVHELPAVVYLTVLLVVVAAIRLVGVRSQ